jgi:hypothetical protein
MVAEFGEARTVRASGVEVEQAVGMLTSAA